MKILLLDMRVYLGITFVQECQVIVLVKTFTISQQKVMWFLIFHQ